MKTFTQNQHTEASREQLATSPAVVPAKVIAKLLSCTSRYVHLLAEAGTIPSYRFGKCCIRFEVAAVFKALGIHTEAASREVAQ